MQLFCPACQAAFSGATRCPRCGGLLLLPHEVTPESGLPEPREPAAAAPPRPTAAGRLMVGVILATGLYVAVLKVTRGVLRLTDPDLADGWLPGPGPGPGLATGSGPEVVPAARSLATAFGAVVAAAGQARGLWLGFGVGLAGGGLFLGYELLAGASPGDLGQYLLLPVLAALGAVAGAVGSRIWGAAPDLSLHLEKPQKLSSSRFLTEANAAPPARPTSWVRVLLGALVIVIGVAVADELRLAAQRYSGGLLRVRSVGQGEYITWQIASLAVLMGGLLAGASTGAGLRHGFLAGSLGGLAVLGLYLKSGGSLPPIDWWLARLSLDRLPPTSPSVAVAVVGGLFLLGTLGGWLGGQLLPPLAPAHRLRRFLD